MLKVCQNSIILVQKHRIITLGVIARILFLVLAHAVFLHFANTVIFIQNFEFRRISTNRKHHWIARKN